MKRRLAIVAIAAVALAGCHSGEAVSGTDSIESDLKAAQGTASAEPAGKSNSLKKLDPKAPAPAGP